jgi:hypothetical protein
LVISQLQRFIKKSTSFIKTLSVSLILHTLQTYLSSGLRLGSANAGVSAIFEGILYAPGPGT